MKQNKRLHIDKEMIEKLEAELGSKQMFEFFERFDIIIASDDFTENYLKKHFKENK